MGPKLVDRLEGSDEARMRLRVILETIAGRRTIAEACEILGIEEARFHELRAVALEGALSSLEPAPVGRPPTRLSADDARVEKMEAEIRELRIELRAAQVRQEIAAVMPHLVERGSKKKARRKKRGAHSRASMPSGGGTRST